MSEVPPTPFASWLTAMQKIHGLPQDKMVAQRVGVPESTVHRWKQGSRPGVASLAALGKMFGTDLVTLLMLTGHLPTPESAAAFQIDYEGLHLGLQAQVTQLEKEKTRLQQQVTDARTEVSQLLADNNKLRRGLMLVRSALRDADFPVDTESRE